MCTASIVDALFSGSNLLFELEFACHDQGRSKPDPHCRAGLDHWDIITPGGVDVQSSNLALKSKSRRNG